MEVSSKQFLQLKKFKEIAVNWNMFQMKEFFHVKKYSSKSVVPGVRTYEPKLQIQGDSNCGIHADSHSTSNCRNQYQLCINCEENNRHSEIKITSCIGQQISAAHVTSKKQKPIRRLGLLMSIATQPPSVSTPSLKTFKVLQVNLGRAKAANNTLQPPTVKLQTVLLQIQEPYVYNSQIQFIPQFWNIFNSISNKIAVIIPSRKLHAAFVSCYLNTVAVKIQTGQQPTTLISAYSSPYSNLQETLMEIQEIITSVRREMIF
ncbi:hypothetical protein AVEN_147586-1 [Araneus ventricosus]|uniref:Uncharacterized protein n=1 Tax=Araneus ventricosus TaxID=182803 RepID=A0A4Y2H4H7_ARAVE|nr:hypothetical protein AVEN_147586-1 [Araneus ventricosus]